MDDEQPYLMGKQCNSCTKFICSVTTIVSTPLTSNILQHVVCKKQGKMACGVSMAHHCKHYKERKVK